MELNYTDLRQKYDEVLRLGRLAGEGEIDTREWLKAKDDFRRWLEPRMSGLIATAIESHRWFQRAERMEAALRDIRRDAQGIVDGDPDSFDGPLREIVKMADKALFAEPAAGPAGSRGEG